MTDLTPDELPTAAESLLSCVQGGHWEDAYNWCLGILSAIHDKAKRDAAQLRQGIERLGFRRIEGQS